MKPEDLAPAHVRAIMPYVPGKPVAETARELGIPEADILKMASNESPIGASPEALAAIRRALDELHYYPDGNGFELKEALSARLGVAPESLVLGNGSNDVLELVARAFLTPADSAVHSQHAFMVYPLAIQAIGARGIVVPAKDYGNDLDAMAAAVRADTKIVFFANPNNPTGTFNPWDEVRSFVERVPDRVLVVVDEAYGEYLPDDLKSPTPGWIGRHRNLVVARTLSKAYGLAGLRVGFAVADPAVAEVMNRVRQPFNVNTLALVAARAASEADSAARSITPSSTARCKAAVSRSNPTTVAASPARRTASANEPPMSPTPITETDFRRRTSPFPGRASARARRGIARCARAIRR
jgi:histidinol-phosphate aminotransferase